MAVVKIVGASHPGKFARELLESESSNRQGTEQRTVEFKVSGYRCRIVHRYESGEIILWFEEEALKPILERILELSEYLGKALVIGVVPGMKWGGNSFISVPGGEIRLSRAGDGLWLGGDGINGFFSATVQGIAELLEVLEGTP